MKVKFAKVSKKKFLEKLKEHKFEDLSTLEMLEKWLLKKRGYVFKMPDKGSEVIMSFSGGLDSTVLLAILLYKYGYTVYPFYIADQPRSKNEYKHAQKILAYFRKRSADQVKHLKFYENKTVGPWAYRKTELDFTNRALVNAIIDLRQHFSLLHSQYVFKKYKKEIKTIFCGIQYHDGEFNPTQTLTGMRTTTFNMCVKTGIYDWQFTSLFLEKEIGFMLDKIDLIKIGAEMKLPLENTWSCYRSGLFHCGKCGNCYVRREKFYEAGITDETIYGPFLKCIKPYILKRTGLDRRIYKFKKRLGLKK